MTKDDGGPAFPVVGLATRDGQPYEHVYNGGMTLRDWLAGMIIQGMMAANVQLSGLTDEEKKQTIAQISASRAYFYADAMLEARKK